MESTQRGAGVRYTSPIRVLIGPFSFPWGRDAFLPNADELVVVAFSEMAPEITALHGRSHKAPAIQRGMDGAAPRGLRTAGQA